ncbi:MAG: DUF58 domain-containing protein [Gammaproteobacteria bacterium]|nr:DUF58 domain-containing protein [Gammaproteobacteria bacterium]
MWIGFWKIFWKKSKHQEADIVFDLIKQFFYSLWHRLKPGKNLFILLVLLCLLGVLVSIWPELLWLWTAALILSSLLVTVDLFRLYGMKKLQIERDSPGKMSLGLWHDIKLTLHYEAGNFSAEHLRVKVFDLYPVNCEYRHLPQQLLLKSGPDLSQRATMHYQIKPLKRGNEQFLGVQCLIDSPWCFWLRNYTVDETSSTMVYPNFAAISQYALLATENRLSQLGIRKTRRRGEGMDFNQLREYREGDSLRQIDWKATSRLRKLISREYQDEKDQEILFLLDCGRRMLSHDDELSHFDHTLNAMLLLSYVALHQGDAIGFSTFGTGDEDDGHGQSQRWFPAKKGMATIQSLLNSVYDLHARAVTPDYTQAVIQLLLRQKKRALIIVLTNLRDEDSHDLLNALQLLKRKHLVILASLKEQALEKVMDKPVDNFSDALLLASTCDYQAQRKKMFESLHARGVNYLDVTPDKLAIRLVNRYLDIKSSGQL